MKIPFRDKACWLAGLIPLLFLLSYPLRNRFFIAPDTTHHFFVVKRWFWDRVFSGEWPLWNDAIFGGVYQMGSPTHEIFSPLTAPLYWTLPGYWPMIAGILLAGTVAGVGAYRLAQAFGLESAARIVFAVGYSLSGPYLSLIDRSVLFTAAALYPWLVLAVMSLAAGPTWGKTAWLAVLVALLVHHGDSIAAGIFCALAVVFAAQTALSRAKTESRWTPLAGVLLASLIGFLLSSVVLFPSSDNLAWTERAAGFSLEAASKWSFHPARFLQMLVPELWGNYFEKSFWGQGLTRSGTNFWYHSLYLGAPLLFLIPWGARLLIRERVALLGLVAAALFTLLSFGEHFPIHRWLHEFSVLYARLRYPEKYFLYSLVIAMLFTLPALKALSTSGGKTWAALWAAVGIVHLLAPFATIALAPEFVLNSKLAPVMNALESAKLAHFALAALALLWAFRCLRSSPSVLAQRNPSMWLLAGYLTLELVLFSPFQPTHRLFAFNEPVRIQKSVAPEPASFHRMLIDAPIDREDFRQTLSPNWGMLYGFRYAFGYETIPPLRLMRLQGREVLVNLTTWAPVLNFGYVLTSLSPRDPDLKRWFEAGALSPVTIDQDSNYAVLKMTSLPHYVSFSTSARLTNAADEGAAAYEAVRKRGAGNAPTFIEPERSSLKGRVGALAPDALARFARFAEQPAEEARAKLLSQKIEANSRTWLIDAEREVLMIVRENFHPGWRALVDGVEVPFVTADYVSYALALPQGRHEIRMEFSPASWRIGACFSLAGLLIVAFIASSRRRRQAPLRASFR